MRYTLTDADYERYAVDANDWVTGYVFPPEGVERLIAERVAEALAPVEALALSWEVGLLNIPDAYARHIVKEAALDIRAAVEQGEAGAESHGGHSAPNINNETQGKELIEHMLQRIEDRMDDIGRTPDHALWLGGMEEALEIVRST